MKQADKSRIQNQINKESKAGNNLSQKRVLLQDLLNSS